MSYYHTCPLCGANLDPGEPCDCGEEEKDHARYGIQNNQPPVQPEELRDVS